MIEKHWGERKELGTRSQKRNDTRLTPDAKKRHNIFATFSYSNIEASPKILNHEYWSGRAVAFDSTENRGDKCAFSEKEGASEQQVEAIASIRLKCGKS